MDCNALTSEYVVVGVDGSARRVETVLRRHESSRRQDAPSSCLASIRPRPGGPAGRRQSQGGTRGRPPERRGPPRLRLPAASAGGVIDGVPVRAPQRRSSGVTLQLAVVGDCSHSHLWQRPTEASRGSCSCGRRARCSSPTPPRARVPPTGERGRDQRPLEPARAHAVAWCSSSASPLRSGRWSRSRRCSRRRPWLDPPVHARWVNHPPLSPSR
jgi:hypothetical protein